MYASDDSQSKFFRANSQTLSNAISMHSLTAEQAEHLIKMEAMLGGQHFKRIGPLLPLDGQCPKCIQIYFYEEHEATKW